MTFERPGFRGEHGGEAPTDGETAAARDAAAATCRALLEGAGDAVIVTDADCRVDRMNAVAEELVGCAEAQARGRPIDDVMRLVAETNAGAASPVGAAVENPARAAMRAGTRVRTESSRLVVSSSDGRVRRVVATAVPIRDDDGAVAGAVLVLHDESGTHAARQTQRASEELFRLALRNSRVAVYQQDRSLRYSHVFNAHPGLTVEAILGKRDEDLFAPEDAARRTALKRGVLDSGVPVRAELPATIGGKTCVFDVTVEPLRDDAGAIVGVTGVSIDVTERKQAEETIRASEARFRHLLDSSITGVAFWKLDGTILDANDVFLRMVGYTREDLRRGRLSWRRITPPEYAHVDEKAARELTASGTCEPFEKEYVRKDGGRVAVLVGSAIFDGESGTGSSFIVDVTERERAASELRIHKDELHRAHQVLSSHLENSPLAIVEWDREFRVMRWFGQAERLFGWSEAEVLHKRPHEWRFVYEDDFPAVSKIMNELSSGAVPRNLSLNRNYTRSGDVIHCEWYNSGVLDDAGQLVSILSLVQDVTERRRAEQALRDLSGRLLNLQDEERRRVARELHDNTAQNLSALAMMLEALERATRREAPAADARLARLSDCRQLAHRTVQEIRTFSYLLHPPLLDDFGLVRAMCEYVRGFSERSGISVEVDAAEERERLPEELEMALFRVLQESLGNVHRHSGSRVARVRLTRDARQVCLEVRDEGRGLPPGVTTAAGAIQVASGVGLLGMRERMRQLGGRMELETGLPGALVRAVLPITRPE